MANHKHQFQNSNSSSDTRKRLGKDPVVGMTLLLLCDKFATVIRRGRVLIEWILMKISYFQGVEDTVNMFWILLWIMIIFFLIGVLYWQFFKIQDVRYTLKNYVHEVHQIAGSLDPSTESIKRCIGILNHLPSLINHPRPPYNYTPFLRACWSGNVTLVRYMLLNGANINSYTSCKETPIYLAAYRLIKNKKWNPSLLDLLYKAGCPLSVPNVKGYTALHCAAYSGQVSLTRWLLMHGAHMSLPPCKATPYDYASQFQDSNHKSIAVLLHLFCPEMAEKKYMNNLTQ